MLESKTRGQSTSIEWKRERGKRLTASNFGKVMSLRESTDSRNLVYNILYASFSNEYTRHGIICEPIARRLFQEKFLKVVDDCGVIVSSEFPFLAASPG